MKLWLYMVVALAVSAAPALAQWVEQGDAGDLPATAQTPAGAGALTTITGALGASDVDMYCINVGQGFQATTCPPNAAFDTQLWLFYPNGNGRSFDDDAAIGCVGSLQSTITGLTPPPGQYFVAISRYDRDAMNGANAIWADTPYGVERAPDGPGAPGPVTSWSGTTTAGSYVIAFQGTTYCGATAVEPTTWGNIKNVYRQ